MGNSSFLTTTTWLIDSGMAPVIDEVISAHLEGRSRDLAEVEARYGKELGRTEKPSYSVVDGVAVFDVNGVIGKRFNMFSNLSGGVSTEQLRTEIQAALDDAKVRALVLSIDSPGGTVDGTVELGDWLLATRRQGLKPIYAYVDGLTASGGYWLASACDRIMAYRSAKVGSVSAMVCHYDRSGADKKNGLKRTFIHSGDKKVLGNDAEPLSDMARAYLQAMVDKSHNMFVAAVAAGRGISEEEAEQKFGDGAVYLADDALAIGMIDEIASLAETIDAARAAGGRRMTKDEIIAQFPEAAEELVADGRAQGLEELEQVRQEGDARVAAEVARVVSVYGGLHGEEQRAHFEKVVASGMTGEQLEALSGCGFCRQEHASQVSGQDTREQILEKLESDNSLVPSSVSSESGDFFEQVKAYAAEHGVTKAQAIKAVKRSDPELYARAIVR